MAALDATEQKETSGDPVPRHPFGSWSLRRLEDAGEMPVTFRATFEPNLRGEFGERFTNRPPLPRNVGTLEQQRPLGPSRQAPIPGEDHSILPPRPLQDFVVGQSPGVHGVTPYEPKVSSQPTDHFVGEPSRFGHRLSEGPPGITLATHIPSRECVARGRPVRLFGTNGIREVVGERLTPEFVTRVADAIGACLPTGSHVVVGWDGRTSSPAFASIVASSLALAGHKVTELGILPTPAIQYNVPRLGGELGVIVTASHNPPEFNGLKCIAKDGLEISREFEERIEVGVERSTAAPVDYARVGEVTHDAAGARRYLEGIFQQVDVARIARRRFSVVLDCGNGASVPTSPALLRRLGCRFVTLNAHVDGTFPGHLSEPTEANLGDLKRAVPAVGAELGVAHDGDADRAVFVDASGRYIPGEEMLTLLAREAVERTPGGIVVTPVSASQSVEDAIRPFGGTVVYTRIGSPSVTREMQARAAVFGGEENGGLIFPRLHLARDGAMTLAAVLDLLARRETDLASLLKDLPRYALVKEKVGCPTEFREKVMERLVEVFSHDSEKVVTIDGVKAYRPGGWVLLRPSGTEPLFRVFAESKDPARARTLANAGVTAVRTALAELGHNR
jgi:phosphomannomutase / phosphoglucomutase